MNRHILIVQDEAYHFTRCGDAQISPPERASAEPHGPGPVCPRCGFRVAEQLIPGTSYVP